MQKAARVMPPLSERKLTDEACRVAAGLVIEEIARRRISRRHLAEIARISLSTLEKALSGRRPLTIATIVRLEEALGIPLRPRTNGGGAPSAPVTPSVAAPLGLAPDELGNYARPAVSVARDVSPVCSS